MTKEIIQLALLTILIVTKILIDRKDAKRADEDLNVRLQGYFKKAMDTLDLVRVESVKANRDNTVVILDDNAKTRKTISELIKSEPTKTGEKAPTIVPEELCEEPKKIHVNDDWCGNQTVSRETNYDKLTAVMVDAGRKMREHSGHAGLLCKDCNTPIYSVDNFCPHCGRRLK